MYRKLMFLISFVALLGLVNSTFAIDWDGGGGDDSFCTPENWDGDVVPGPGDEAYAECPPGEIVIDCDVVVDALRLPAMEGDCNQTMTMSSHSITAGNWRGAYEGNKVGIVNATGGIITITGGGDSLRFTEDGGDNTFGYVNFGGDLLVNALESNWRCGDNGGNAFVDVSGNAVVNIGGYARIGDDAAGSYTFRGNSQSNFFGQYETAETSLQTGCRDKSVDFYLQDNAQVYCAGTMMWGKYYSSPGMVSISGGTLNAKRLLIQNDNHMLMTGGTLIGRDKLEMDGDATINLEGGTIEAGDLEIDGSAVMDVNGGTLILEGNKLALVFGYVDTDKLTGCGSARGIKADYGTTNPGKTTVTSTCEFDPCQAWGPNPADGADKVRSVVTEVVLGWNEGDCLGFRGRNSVYFGDDYDDVTDANTADSEWIGFFQFRGGDASVNVGNLPLWENRYWRIDSFNGILDVPPVTPGLTWTFTTGCEAIVGDINMDCLVNFLDYAELANTFGEEEMWPE